MWLKDKNTKWVIAVFIISCVICVLVIIRICTPSLNNSGKTETDSLKRMIYLLKHDKYMDGLYYEKALFSEGKTLNNIKLISPQYDSALINQLITKPVLVFHFTENCCPPCVNDYISILNQLSDSIGKDKIFIISRFDDVKKLKIKSIENGIKTLCYNSLQKLNIVLDEDENMERPFFFIIDKNLTISFPRIGDPKDSINSPYFRRIITLMKEAI